MPDINVGLVGYKFMGKAHSNAYRGVNFFFQPRVRPVMKALCGRDEAAVREAARRYGWESVETSWEKLVGREDIDLVDISTPNYTHRAIALAAAAAGKHIFCEKPVAMNVAEAREMLSAAEKAGVKHMVCFNYRRVPAIALARQMIDEGRLGRIYHFRAAYLQSWITDPGFPLVWRLKKEFAGSGAHGDLNSHLVDLARFLVGEIEAVTGLQDRFITERPEMEEANSALGARAADATGEVTVDDAALFLARFSNGAVGSFEATRFGTGRKNSNRIELNGSKGSLALDLERMNELQYFSTDDSPHVQGFRTIQVTEPVHPYMNAWWPPGHTIGYEHTFTNTVYDLMEAVAEDRMPEPNLVDGLRCQEVLEAVSRAASEKRWVKISEVR